MPIPAVLLPSLISAGGSLLGTGTNAAMQGIQNAKARRWNEKMYDWQRRDALSDYAMQNLYNHPSSQMARLREAGLNPNLVYGNGAVATGGQVRQSGVESWNPKAPELDFGGAINTGLSAYALTEMKEAQLDNLRMNNTVMVQEAALKAAQIQEVLARVPNIQVGTKTAEFDLGLKSEIRDISIEALRSSVEKTQAETSSILTHQEIALTMKAPNLTKALEEILSLRKGRARTDEEIRHIDRLIENLYTDNEIKRQDLALKQKGIQPHDPIVRRIVAEKIKTWFSRFNAGTNYSGGIKYAPVKNSEYGKHRKYSGKFIQGNPMR